MKVTYIDHMGTDLSVVNAARVSFGKRSEWEYYDKADGVKVYEVYAEQIGSVYTWYGKRLSDRDAKLIQFLARGCTSWDWEGLIYEAMGAGFDGREDDLVEILNHVKNMPTHWTPFGHTAITLHIKAPIFVARQLGKHQVGMVWNEVSRRYVTDEPEFYVPDVWRKAADNVKQGSSDEAVSLREVFGWDTYGKDMYSVPLAHYKAMIKNGVCPEQARMVLPQSMYTEWYWTGNLYSFANVFIQRTDSHAQREVQEIAHQIGGIIKPLFPVSWAALTGEKENV